MLTLSKQEWRWLLSWSAAILLISSLPYLYGLWLSTPQMQFSGFFIGVEDANSYLAKMRQGAEGGWLFHLPYTPEPHQGAYLFSFHLLLGKLARLGSIPLPLMYHLARLVFGLGLLLTLYYFISYFTPQVAQRRFAFLLAAGGSGLGWLVIALQLTPRLGLPLDLYVPEAFIFLVLFHLPHLALAETLLFWAVLWTLQSWQTNHWLPILGAACALLGVALIAAFYVGVFVIVLGLTALALTLWGETMRGAMNLWLKLICAPLLSLPVLLYDAYVFSANPVLAVWSQQNLILSPEPWHYLLAYGPLILLAVYGALHLVNSTGASVSFGRKVALTLLMTWCLVFPLLVYLPFNLQRRLVVGVQLPLAVLAAAGVFFLTDRLRPDRQRWLRAGLLALFSLTNLALLLGGLVSISLRQPPIFHPASQLEAMRWLDRAASGELVLAVYETGNVLPAYANVRTFVGHGPETIHSDEKRAQAQQFFAAATSDAWRRDLLAEFNVRYVYYGPAEKAAGDFAPARAPYLEEIYHQGDVQIFEVKL
ncbi:MAG: hypothetical protein L6R45_14590 [Anaerolineae bacterium]|nr:hypothetical protein [Anaerolineae bacterium]